MLLWIIWILFFKHISLPFVLLQATENLGMAMLYTLVASAKDWLSGRFGQDGVADSAADDEKEKDEVWGYLFICCCDFNFFSCCWMLIFSCYSLNFIFRLLMLDVDLVPNSYL